LGISVRSVYRDIDTLRGQGAVIGGEAGVGFVLSVLSIAAISVWAYCFLM